MWLFPTKKEVKSGFDKVKEQANAIMQDITEIRKNIEAKDALIKELRDKIDTASLKVATLEGYILNKSQVSVSKASQGVSKQSQGKYETNLIQNIRKNKKSLVIAELLKLEGNYSVTEMFNHIVNEKGLCSKASFYRYIDNLKSHKFETNKETIETKLRHKTKV